MSRGKIVFIAIVSIFTGILAGGLIVKELNQTFLSSEVQVGFIQYCEEGNDVREVFRKQLRKDKKDLKDTPRSFFPNIPAGKFRRLKREERRDIKRNIEQLHHIRCEEEFKADRSPE